MPVLPWRQHEIGEPVENVALLAAFDYDTPDGDNDHTARFQPVQSVRYDWLLTYPANHIIVGLEKPWEHPEAFGGRGNEQWWLRYAREMREAGRTGHPTLSATFSCPDEEGAVSGGGQAIIGGELVYQNAGRWLINNNSGRFGIITQRTGETHDQHVERVLALLEELYAAP
jgi:hypothetical protein